MKKIIFFHKTLLLIIVLMIPIVQCKISDKDIVEIFTVTPETVFSYMPVIMTVKGSGFNSNSEVMFNKATTQTVYVNSGELTCSLDKSFSEFSLTSESMSIPIQVKNTDSTSDEVALSNIVNINLRHTRECSDQVSIDSGQGLEYRELLHLFVSESPKLFIIVQELLTSATEYQYKLLSSDDNGTNWTSISAFPILNHYFFLNGKICGWIYANSNVDFYMSDENGENWNKTGSFVIPQPETNFSLDSVNVRNNSDGGIYLIYGYGNQDLYILNLNTYYTENIGADWEIKGTYSFDISFTYGSLNVGPLIVNNTGGIRLAYDYPYGRYGAGGGLVSEDGGVTFTASSKPYGKNGGTFFLTDENILIYRSRSMYMPYSYKDNFGSVEGFGDGDTKNSFYLEDLFQNYPEGYDGGGVGLTMDNNKYLYLYWKNFISRSVDNGANWTTPFNFLGSAIENGSYLMKISGDNSLYVIMLDEENNLLFTMSE